MLYFKSRNSHILFIHKIQNKTISENYIDICKNISIAFTQVIPCKGYVELMLSYHKIPAGGDTVAVVGTIVNYKYMKK